MAEKRDRELQLGPIHVQTVQGAAVSPQPPEEVSHDSRKTIAWMEKNLPDGDYELMRTYTRTVHVHTLPAVRKATLA